MKMFKKIAATVIAAAMSLAMLTACGGGGGGSSAVVIPPRDTAKEDQVIAWTQEYASANGLELEKSDAVSSAAAMGLSDGMKVMDIALDKADGDLNAASQAMTNNIGAALSKQGKVGMPLAMRCKKADFKKEEVAKTYSQVAYRVMETFKHEGITPKTVGAAVTVQNELVYIVMVVAS